MNGIRVGMWNANGLTSKTNELTEFLRINHIDIMLISETHFNQNSYINIPGYNIINSNNPNRRLCIGGAAILITKTLSFQPLAGISERHVQAARVSIPTELGAISIAACYWPPGYRNVITNNMVCNFFNTIGPNCLIGGDWNAKARLWGNYNSCPRGNLISRFVLSSSQYNVLTTAEPTHFPSNGNTPSVLDFGIINGISPNRFTIRRVMDLSSDHIPIIIDFALALNRFNTQNHRILTRHSNLKAFRRKLHSEIDLNVKIVSTADADDMINVFTNKIYDAAKLASTRPINRCSSTHNTTFSSDHRLRQQPSDLSRPPLRGEVIELVRLKRRLRKRYTRSRHFEDRIAWQQTSRQLSQTLQQIRSAHFSSILLNADPNKKGGFNLWRACKGLKQQPHNHYAVKDQHGNWCQTVEEQVEAFADELENRFTPHNLSPSEHVEMIQATLVNCNNLSTICSSIRIVTLNEIQSAIKQLETNKAPGCDKIDNFVLKSLPHKAVEFITKLFNCLLVLRHFPIAWKCANISMIPKSDYKNVSNVSSYRPISLLPSISKLFEKIIYSRLSEQIEFHSLIPEHQFGFRDGHSTIQQIHRIMHHINTEFEFGNSTSAVFIDIAQAFDRVWHEGLLYKLSCHISDPLFHLIKSFLSNRSFVVKDRGIFSRKRPILAGVPQGSVLAPLLYNIYTYDMPSTFDTIKNAYSKTLTATYADDTAFCISGQIPYITNSMQKHLDAFEDWAKTWNIKINEKKSTHVIFSLQNRIVWPDVTLNSIKVPPSSSVKYLGLYLDRKLLWSRHIHITQRSIESKLKKYHWLLNPRSRLSLSNKLLIYKQIIAPCWQYGIELYGCASDIHIRKIQVMQSKALRLIVNPSTFYVSNKTLHTDMKVSSVFSTINTNSIKYWDRLKIHTNKLIKPLYKNTNRRLQRTWPTELRSRKPPDREF